MSVGILRSGLWVGAKLVFARMGKMHAWVHRVHRAWGFQECEGLIVAKEAVFLFWYWSLLEQLCIVSSDVWKETPKRCAVKSTSEMLSLWCSFAAWGCNTENDAEHWSLCLQTVVIHRPEWLLLLWKYTRSAWEVSFGLPSSGLIQWVQLLDIKSSTFDVEIQSQTCVCVCLYICIWFQNHCLWAETYLENRMYKIPLCSSPSVDKPHFQAASQFELLRGKMSNFPSRHSSCILKGYDRFGCLWAYICKLFPQLCISAIGNKKTNVSLTWKPYCMLAVFPLQACLPAGSLLFVFREALPCLQWSYGQYLVCGDVSSFFCWHFLIADKEWSNP